jgi:hypothetical protein
MKIGTLPAVMAGLLALGALPGAAQEKQKPEVLPEPEQPHPAVPVQPAMPASCGADCARPGFKVLWVEREVPIQILVPREVITPVPSTTVEVAYRDEKRLVTEFALKPREVEKPVTVCTLKPVTVTDCHTGQCSTVMQPCTQVKMVKTTEFVAVPEEKAVVVKVPYLKLVEVTIPHKNILLEYRTDLRKEGGAIRVPCPDLVPQERMLLAPKAPCPQ